MTEFRLPTAAELYALEQYARRERAKAQAQLIRAAFGWIARGVKFVFTRPYAVRTGSGRVRHA